MVEFSGSPGQQSNLSREDSHKTPMTTASLKPRSQVVCQFCRWAARFRARIVTVLTRLREERWVPVLGYVCACAGVLLVTGVISLVRSHARIANVSSLYLIAVLGVAATFGSGPAITASILAFLAFDWFFVSPVGQFTVSDPDEWLSLLLFLMTAIVTSQLAAAQQRRAVDAQRREREVTALYRLSTLVARQPEPTRFLPELAGQLGGELEVTGVWLLRPDANGQLAVVPIDGNSDDMPPLEGVAAREAFEQGELVETSGSDARQTAGRRSFEPEKRQPLGAASLYVPLLVGERRIGVLRLIRAAGAAPLTSEQRRLLRAAAQQIGLALERAQLQAAAAEAAALRRADQMKGALLNAVSHDFRTPLALIKAAAGSLRQRDVDWTDDERDSFTLAIEQEVDRLDRIVGNLLDISQIEAGMLHPDRQPYPLAALVDEVLARLRPILVGYRISVEIPDDLPPVLVDYDAVDRVLSNLLENVERHTPPGTTVIIRAWVEGNRVVVRMADDGPGIDPADLPRIFDTFYRGRSNGRGRTRGSGLGLAVVKGLIEAHGETISLDSRPGVGTSFTFGLPVRSRTEVGVASPTSAQEQCR
jgi:two-component system sensor histidine kinase KdpD